MIVRDTYYHDSNHSYYNERRSDRQPKAKQREGPVTRVPSTSPGVLALRLELLRAVRRIMRAFDVHSRRMAASADITLPQLLCLTAVVAEEGAGPCRTCVDH
jgi:hypothetical protein